MGCGYGSCEWEGGGWVFIQTNGVLRSESGKIPGFEKSDRSQVAMRAAPGRYGRLSFVVIFRDFLVECHPACPVDRYVRCYI